VDCEVEQVGPDGCTDQCGTVTGSNVITAQSGNGAACVDTTYECQSGDGACPDNVDCEVEQVGPDGCTDQCGTVTGSNVITDQSGNGAACVDTTYECQSGDGACPACLDTLLELVGNSYECDGHRDSNQVDCSVPGAIYNFNEPFRFSFSFISDVEQQYGHILGFRNFEDDDSPQIAFGYRYLEWRDIGATATLTARNNDGVFVMSGQYGHTNLATTNILVNTEINVEFTWDGAVASATINGQAFSTESGSGFGTYSRAQLCYGIGGGASAFVGTINNLEIISPLEISLGNANGLIFTGEEESMMSEFAAPTNGLILTRALAIVGLSFSVHFLWSSCRSQNQFQKIPDEQDV